MSDDEVEEYNIADVKRLFFDPRCGGSKQCGEAVEKLVEGYRAAFKYLNAMLSTRAQREIETETDDVYWITPEQMKRQVSALLTSGHSDEVSQEKFREAAHAMGMTIPYEPGFEREGLESDFRSNLAEALADHYVANVMLERAAVRGARD